MIHTLLFLNYVVLLYQLQLKTFPTIQPTYYASFTIEQFIFFFENDSDAAPKTAISFTPTFNAASNPYIFGTKTGYDIFGSLLMLENTSEASPI